VRVRFKDFIGRYVKEISLFSIKINIEELRKDAVDFTGSFTSLLRQIYGNLSEDYKGIVLILDDLNGLTKNPKFSYLMKSTIDEIATSSAPLPILLLLCGIEQRRLEIISHHSSVARIFSVVDIEPLSNEEVSEFFTNSFISIGMEIEEVALELMVKMSAGLPRIMHEIGNNVFWVMKGETINNDDALNGTVVAIHELGRKYFGPLQKVITTDEYRSILRILLNILSDKPLFLLSFSRKEILNELSEEEKSKLNNFLQRMKRLNAIHPGENKGEWMFTDNLTCWYFRFETEELLKHKRIR